MFNSSLNLSPTLSPKLSPSLVICLVQSATLGLTPHERYSEPMTRSTAPARTITALVLCGGAARRMGGVDKPLELWNGQTLVAHALSRLPTDVPVLISANRNRKRYAQLGWPVITDASANAGPLAGIEAAASQIKTPWLYVVPGDAPLLPKDLALAMQLACVTQNAIACCARVDQRQPLPMLVATAALMQLSAYLKRGERSVGGWLTQLGAIELQRPDDGRAFANFNTRADLTNPDFKN